MNKNFVRVKSVKNILSLLLVLPTLLFSQIDGSINGYIYDSKSQSPLLGANVIIEGTEKGAISDENDFEITNVSPKSYNLSVSYVDTNPKRFLTS